MRETDQFKLEVIIILQRQIATLKFDRKRSYGKRLNIPSGTSIRFEPGQNKNIELVDILGC